MSLGNNADSCSSNCPLPPAHLINGFAGTFSPPRHKQEASVIPTTQRIRVKLRKTRHGFSLSFTTFPPDADRRRGIPIQKKARPFPCTLPKPLAWLNRNTGRRNAPCASLHIGASPQPCRSDFNTAKYFGRTPCLRKRKNQLMRSWIGRGGFAAVGP